MNEPMTFEEMAAVIAEARQRILTQNAIIEGQKLYIEVLEQQMDKLRAGVGKAALLADMLSDISLFKSQV
jgi:hypothetical protein